jgi:hypothetical protein
MAGATRPAPTSERDSGSGTACVGVNLTVTVCLVAQSAPLPRVALKERPSLIADTSKQFPTWGGSTQEDSGLAAIAALPRNGFLVACKG